jgi:3-oxoacyl-[acyl-carrier protein] reductase
MLLDGRVAIDTGMIAAMPLDKVQALVDQIPLGRIGRPEEVGRTVAFLASDYAEFITGKVVDINGGAYTA